MSKKDDLLNNNDEKKPETKVRQTRKKKPDNLISLKEESQVSNIDNNENKIISNDEVINVELYNEILSTLFNSLNNPIIRNEIKVNEDILKYLELQISNLFFLETALSKQLAEKKMAKEFLQLTANILDLALTVNKSHKKSRIEILEDRNLLIVTIVNSCKGVERESLERIRVVDAEALQNLSNQVAALSNFTTEEINSSTTEDTSFNNSNNLEENNNQNPNNTLNNQNFRDLNNNMANLTKMGLLPEHPASNPNFYPYLSKPTIVPKLKKVLAGMLGFSALMIIITMIISSFVKGTLLIDETKDPVNFVLSQTNNWLMLIMTVILYFSFAYMFIRPTKLSREKYRISYFMLGLLFFWLLLTIGYAFYQMTDNYYLNIFLASVKKENLNPDIIKDLKALPNYQIYRIFVIITAAVSILPLLLVIVLMLINPRLDRKKVMRANMEYQNAMSAALNGQKYEMDPSLFDKDDKPEGKKRKKANFSGRF